MSESEISIKLPAVFDELLKRSIVITGAPRSGTTLLGNIVGTMAGVEYFFEPPMFHMLSRMHAAGALAAEPACLLLASYCCDDLLLEAAQGRGVNLRPTDDSLFLRRHTWSELNRRWHEVRGRKHAIEATLGRRSRLALKMPNSMDGCELAAKTFADAYFVILVRDGRDVVSSVLRRGWVKDSMLDTELWPYRNLELPVNVPYWVPEAWLEKWQSLGEASRAVLMWCHHAEISDELTSHAPQRGLNCLTVSYEELVATPGDTLNRVMTFLGVKPGGATESLVAKIHAGDQSHREGWQAIAQNVEPELLHHFYELNRQRGYDKS